MENRKDKLVELSFGKLAHDFIVQELDRRKDDGDWRFIGFNFLFAPELINDIDFSVVTKGIDASRTDTRLIQSNDLYERILQVWIFNPDKEYTPCCTNEYPIVSAKLCSDGVNYEIKRGRMVFIED